MEAIKSQIKSFFVGVFQFAAIMTKILIFRDTFVINAGYIDGKLQSGCFSFNVFKKPICSITHQPAGQPGGRNHERSSIMNKKLIIGLLAMIAIVVFSLPAAAERKGKGPPGFGELYYEGEIVRTVVPPASMPFLGRDNLYAFPDGEQMAITAVAPGDPEYHGGQWALHLVTWNTSSYLLTSEAEVLTAGFAGDVTIVRVPENDFKCPVQP